MMRRALLAALIALPLPLLADPTTLFDEVSGSVIVTGLRADERVQILADPDALRLQVTSLDSASGMPVALEEQGDAIIVAPRFPLRSGTAYALRIDAGDAVYRLEIALPEPDWTVPNLTGFAPSQSVIPSNTLRLYLQFSEPMARGQLRDALTLIAGDGTLVASPFLNLAVELWDPSQTRATLLFDPGRIKQGVGPNMQAGAPLQPGESYQLVVSGRMESAAGVPLGADATLGIRVGPPERRAIDPADWHILAPAAGNHAPLTVAFDRVMDIGGVQRFLQLRDSEGSALRGQITSDSGGWSFAPEQAWQAGTYDLIVAPELEDISGNTIGAPFDAATGTIGTHQAPVILTININ